MAIYFLYEEDEKNFFRGGDLRWHDIYYSIFRKAYPNTEIIKLPTNKIWREKLKKNDLVISFQLLVFEKIKKISCFIKSKGAKFGLCLGDSSQYLWDIYEQFLPIIDFCIAQELGESNLYENLYGKPAFDHPIFQLTDHSILFKKIPRESLSKREFTFVHLGRIEKQRKNRVEGILALRNSNFKYSINTSQSLI